MSSLVMVRARHHAARAVTSQRDSCHVWRGCHEVGILILITITTSHLLAAVAAAGWGQPSLFLLYCFHQRSSVFIANNYTFTFSFCVLVSFFIILTHVSFDGCQINFVVVKIIINIMYTFNWILMQMLTCTHAIDIRCGVFMDEARVWSMVWGPPLLPRVIWRPSSALL